MAWWTIDPRINKQAGNAHKYILPIGYTWASIECRLQADSKPTVGRMQGDESLDFQPLAQSRITPLQHFVIIDAQVLVLERTCIRVLILFYYLNNSNGFSWPSDVCHPDILRRGEQQIGISCNKRKQRLRLTTKKLEDNSSLKTSSKKSCGCQQLDSRCPPKVLHRYLAKYNLII